MADQDSVQPQAAGGADTISHLCIPVIFVPGVMGSRFSTSAGRNWDPDSSLSMAKWFSILKSGKQTTRQAISTTLSTATVMSAFSSVGAAGMAISTNIFVRYVAKYYPGAAQVGTQEQIDAFHGTYAKRGWAGLAWGFYGQIVKYLESNLNTDDLPQRFPVYAYGYDWRQSNTVSGQGLAAFITKTMSAKENMGASQVVIVTHSMGGLVVRGMLQANPAIASQVLGVVHCLQPSNGAPVCYRRFLSGMAAPYDATSAAADKVLNNILGTDPQTYAYNMSGAPGPLQLLPNHLYQANYDGGGAWISTSDSSLDLSQIFQLYGGTTWPGIMGSVTAGQVSLGTDSEQSGGTVVSDFTTNLAAAQTFHEAVGSTYHGNTYVLYSSGLSTDDSVAFVDAPITGNTPEGPSPAGSGGGAVPGSGSASAIAVARGGSFRPKKVAMGDGTVPSCSARCPGCTSPLAPPDVASTALEHSAVFADDNFNAKVLGYVQKLLALHGS